MSPSESDLRAALQHGDGDGLDVDHVVFAARARIAERRMRIVSGTAIVLVIAGAGVGGTLLARTGGSSVKNGSNAAAGGAADNAKPHPAAQSPANGGQGGGRSVYSYAAVPCPRAMPQYLLPGGGSPGQFGASGALFSKPVASVVVCAYGDTASKPVGKTVQPGRLDIGDGQAKQLAQSLESAPKTPTPTGCSEGQQTHELAIIGLAADGSRVGTVTASLNTSTCGQQVTNGTAIRYGWTPPSALKSVLLALKPAS